MSAPVAAPPAGPSPPSRPTWRAAATTAAALSAWFVVIYGFCGWFTAQRADVGVWYFAWEKYLPVVPWMIVPYMSLDLFFVAAPFCCATRRELQTLARRLAWCIAAAGAGFLALPLTLGWPRPEVEGWAGPIFRFLHGFDGPGNLFPSLHIALRTILAAHYGRHTRGALHAVVQFWFVLIGISTLLTGQHHVPDVAGGFVLGLLCVYLIREDGRRLPVRPNYRVAAYYAAGGAALGAAGVAGWPWTIGLWWPAGALVLIAGAYAGLGPGIYRKTAGAIPFSARLIFAPVHFGQWLSLLHYKRQGAVWHELAPNVWIGALPNAREARAAAAQGVRAVLDLTAEFSETPTFRRLIYRNLPVLDLTGLSVTQMRAAADFIAAESARGPVYVHCKAGYSRTAAAAGAYLLASGRARDVPDAVAQLRRARPAIVLRPETHRSLAEFHAACSAGEAALDAFPPPHA